MTWRFNTASFLDLGWTWLLPVWPTSIETMGLMMRHWNTIAGTLFKGEVYVPMLLEDENGVAHGNDWARGFMRGMGMRRDGWAELVIPRCGQPNWPDC
jgi:hypothetical protein